MTDCERLWKIQSKFDFQSWLKQLMDNIISVTGHFTKCIPTKVLSVLKYKTWSCSPKHSTYHGKAISSNILWIQTMLFWLILNISTLVECHHEWLTRDTQNIFYWFIFWKLCLQWEQIVFLSQWICLKTAINQSAKLLEQTKCQIWQGRFIH